MGFESMSTGADQGNAGDEIQERLKSMTNFDHVQPGYREAAKKAAAEGRGPTDEEMHESMRNWWLNTDEGQQDLEEQISGVRPELREFARQARLENIDVDEVDGFTEERERLERGGS